MLQAEHAVLFIFFPWSGQAVQSRDVVLQWQKQAAPQSGQTNYTAYELAPDNHPFTWKWISEAIGHGRGGENGYGSVGWVCKGIVKGFVPNGARVGAGILERVTNDCFVFGKTHTSESIALLQNEPRPFDMEFLKILCCPETHQALSLAEASVLDKVNQRLAVGALRNRAGQPVEEKVEDGLVRADGRYLYPMRRNIPVLLVDEAIPLAG